jgi:hypothetical protein
MAVMAPRESWTDERLDDLKEHMDEGFREVRADLRQQRGEMARQKDMDARLSAQQKEMDARFDAVDKRFDDLIHMMQIGFGVIGALLTLITAMLAGVIGLIVTHF